MPRPQLILLGRIPLPDTIAQRLGIFIGDPHCGQITGPVTACQLRRIPPVGLDAVSRLLRNQRRRHIALDSQLRQLPVEYEARRASFLAGPQMLGRTQLPDQLADRFFAVGDRSQAANLAIWFGYCYSYRFGMDIHAQKS
jgi:hypothetical protein